jgi:hypothetical protein
MKRLLAVAVAWVVLTSAAAVVAAAGVQVAWISREPPLAPPQSAKASREEGWPAENSRVEWVAHVINRGADTLAGAAYAWRLDGETVASGRVDAAPGETKVSLVWPWTFTRHALTFEIEGDRLTLATDALGLGAWVERGTYDWLSAAPNPGFERWLQREIDSWNTILARAVYPTTPAGAIDRIRLDQVMVVPDGTRPRNGDLFTDLHWYFLNAPYERGFVGVYADPRYASDQTIILHELMHQRGLTDLYAYDVVHGDVGRTDSRIEIVENGKPVVGSPLMPFVNGYSVYHFPVNGLMGSNYRAGSANLTEHCANGLNLVAGHRTPLWLDRFGHLIDGYSNADNPDSYLFKMPQRTEVSLVDQQGARIAGATVEVFLDHSRDSYQKRYGPQPDRTFSADEQGVAVLPGDLLDPLKTGIAQLKAETLIVGVKTSRARGYAFVPVYDLNLLYFRQGPERGEMELKVKLVPY